MTRSGSGPGSPRRCGAATWACSSSLCKSTPGRARPRSRSLGERHKAKVSDLERGVGEVKHLAVFEQIADGLNFPDSARMALGLAPRSSVPQQQAAGKTENMAAITTRTTVAERRHQTPDDEHLALELTRRARPSGLA